MRGNCCQAFSSPLAHSCERAQVSGKQGYSRGFGSCNPAISRNGRPTALGRTHRLPHATNAETIQKAGTALTSEIPMADQTSATCFGPAASMQQISCSHWLPLHGLGSVGLLAFSHLFDFPQDYLERAILHDLPQFSGRSTFSRLRTCAGCSHRTTGARHGAASAYPAPGSPRPAF